jgi:Xaa-Pro dipeptidase
VQAPDPYRGRIERTQARLAERALDALLDLSAVDVAYLTGFLGGYRAENTRTYFVGTPPVEVAELSRLVEETQASGRRQVAPGVSTREVNAACLAALRAAGCGQLVRHRVGHGVGLEGHEPPWVEDGDPTVLAPGMVVSVEPGLYDPTRGGCLIADTVEVTAAGAVSLTESPRAWADVVVPG